MFARTRSSLNIGMLLVRICGHSSVDWASREIDLYTVPTKSLVFQAGILIETFDSGIPWETWLPLLGRHDAQ